MLLFRLFSSCWCSFRCSFFWSFWFWLAIWCYKNLVRCRDWQLSPASDWAGVNAIQWLCSSVATAHSVSTAQDGSARIPDIFASLSNSRRKWRHDIHLFYSLWQGDFLWHWKLLPMSLVCPALIQLSVWTAHGVRSTGWTGSIWQMTCLTARDLQNDL